MQPDILKKLSTSYSKYIVNEVEAGASKKKIYRIKKNNNSFIIIDFIKDKKEFDAYLNVYNILKNVNISIPKIIEVYKNHLMIVTDDFGNLRFDKILEKYSIKKLLNYAVDALVVLNNANLYKKNSLLNTYNFDTFKGEVLELSKYYFPYINIKDEKIKEEFISLWSESYKSYNFDFKNFTHKDFNINNLVLLPSNKNHLRCGILDFQSSFWGESSWDLFSLLEDSRILFNDEFNEYFIEYFFLKTNQSTSFHQFRSKLNFLNSSRQTRLLGRWVKLAKEKNDNTYKNFINVTQNRLKKSLSLLGNKNLDFFYNKYIFKV